MSQQSVRQAAGGRRRMPRPVLRMERANRQTPAGGLAVAVLTALGERHRAVRDAEGPCCRGATDDDRRRGPVRPRGGRVLW